MTEKRSSHACMFDETTTTVHVMGGTNIFDVTLDTTEKWTNGTDYWQQASTLIKNLRRASAVSSRSKTFVGFISGGWSSGFHLNEIWGLRRLDMIWVKMPEKLEIIRAGHSMVNIPGLEVLECQGCSDHTYRHIKIYF